MMGALALKNVPARTAGKPAEQQVAAFNLDGEIILIDTTMVPLMGKPLCLVIRSDGTYGIERAWNKIRSGNSRRHGYYDVLDHHEGDGHASYPCTILGRVIGPEPLEHYAAPHRIERLTQELSTLLSSEYGGDYVVTIESGGRIDYRWAKPQAA